MDYWHISIMAVSTGRLALEIGLGALVYLVVIVVVAALVTRMFGDVPALVAIAAVLWPWLLIPVLLVAAGYRLGGGHRIDGRRHP
ncbi:MAG TPA: hypothetical protein VMR97_14445 [Acidimicrobiales bacterium]|nr:hypothetical protein [Acidimicrobiales bacterium]